MQAENWLQTISLNVNLTHHRVLKSRKAMHQKERKKEIKNLT